MLAPMLDEVALYVSRFCRLVILRLPPISATIAPPLTWAPVRVVLPPDFRLTPVVPAMTVETQSLLRLVIKPLLDDADAVMLGFPPPTVAPSDQLELLDVVFEIVVFRAAVRLISLRAVIATLVPVTELPAWQFLDIRNGRALPRFL